MIHPEPLIRAGVANYIDRTVGGGVSTHWPRHTSPTWVERHFGYGAARWMINCPVGDRTAWNGAVT